MKKYLVIASLLVAACLAVAVGIWIISKPAVAPSLGFDGGNSNPIPFVGKEFNQIASRSVSGTLKSSGGRVFAIEVTTDSALVKYLQLFDIRDAVPSRAASKSSGGQWIYTASISYPGMQMRTPGAWQHYASQSLVFSVPLTVATSSTSLGVTRIDSTMFSPAKLFSNGILWGLSNTFGAYSSASTADKSARYMIRLIYE